MLRGIIFPTKSQGQKSKLYSVPPWTSTNFVSLFLCLLLLLKTTFLVPRWKPVSFLNSHENLSVLIIYCQIPQDNCGNYFLFCFSAVFLYFGLCYWNTLSSFLHSSFIFFTIFSNHNEEYFDVKVWSQDLIT